MLSISLSAHFEVFSQEYALVDLKAKLPVLYTDSVTSEHFKHGYVPIEKDQIKSLYSELKQCSELLGKRSRSKADVMTIGKGNSLVQITRIPMANADRYVISIISAVPNAEIIRSFGDENQYNKHTKKKIDRFLDYLKDNLTDIKLLN